MYVLLLLIKHYTYDYFSPQQWFPVCSPWTDARIPEEGAVVSLQRLCIWVCGWVSEGRCDTDDDEAQAHSARPGSQRCQPVPGHLLLPVHQSEVSTWSLPTTSTSIRSVPGHLLLPVHHSEVSTWSLPMTSTSVRSVPGHLAPTTSTSIRSVPGQIPPTHPSGQYLVTYHQYINQRSVPGHIPPVHQSEVSTWSHTTSTSIRSVPGHIPPVHQSEVSTWLPPTTSTSIRGQYLVKYHQHIHQVSTWSHTTSTSIRGQYLVTYHQYINQRSVPGHIPPVYPSGQYLVTYHQYINQRSVPGCLLPPVHPRSVPGHLTPTTSTSIRGQYLITSYRKMRTCVVTPMFYCIIQFCGRLSFPCILKKRIYKHLRSIYRYKHLKLL